MNYRRHTACEFVLSLVRPKQRGMCRERFKCAVGEDRIHVSADERLFTRRSHERVYAVL